MISRWVRASGAMTAVRAAVALAAAGIVVGDLTVGVTRQPLPLIWLVSAFYVTAATMVLPATMPGGLGQVESHSPRGRTVRAARAVVAVLMVLPALVYTEIVGPQGMSVWLCILMSLGFVAGSAGTAQPWAWPLGVGLAAVGIQFLTPVALINALTMMVRGSAATAVLGAAGLAYVVLHPLIPRGGLPGLGRRRPTAPSA